MSDFPRFSRYVSPDDYRRAGVLSLEPMTAKEIEDDADQREALNTETNILEEKFDGTRALLHFYAIDRRNMPLPLDAYLNDGFDPDKYECLDSVLHRDHVVEMRKRIYAFMVGNTYSAATEKYVANQFGVGGVYGDGMSVDWNARGMHFKTEYRNPEYSEWKYTWAQVSGRIRDLIAHGMYFTQDGYTRCFSRRISKKTDWYCENTDSLPHLRDLNIPALDGTVIDGEMFIPDRPFRDVAGTLNCTWDEAVKRQNEMGQIVFHAFDILYYKGVCCMKMPLHRRKYFLEKVCQDVFTYCRKNDLPCAVQMVPYYVPQKDTIPAAFTEELSYRYQMNRDMFDELRVFDDVEVGSVVHLPAAALFEWVVLNGGEGVIVKDRNGRYHHKRGWEYSKIKKFLTREVIVLGFAEPTKEYNGKTPNTLEWPYWEKKGRVYDLRLEKEKREFLSGGGDITPVSKFYAENWVGNIRFGVLIEDADAEALARSSKGKDFEFEYVSFGSGLALVVGECSGFDEDQRALFTLAPENYIGTVIEVKANEIFKDTGRMRHPRFLRTRADKNPEECTWENHIQ